MKLSDAVGWLHLEFGEAAADLREAIRLAALLELATGQPPYFQIPEPHRRSVILKSDKLLGHGGLVAPGIRRGAAGLREAIRLAALLELATGPAAVISDSGTTPEIRDSEER